MSRRYILRCTILKNTDCTLPALPADGRYPSVTDVATPAVVAVSLFGTAIADWVVVLVSCFSFLDKRR